MPHKEQRSQLNVVELHPTFAAEIRGVDFENLEPDVFDEIHRAISKYGVVKFPKTGLDDAGHVAFAARLVCPPGQA
ncbi:hypothetical protein LTR53_014648 [Teratosphaeriaceae sp. CCFEE 6253]|nr:hypothetical protein LTR53_014648 [Teratosphaeriaceae sp. CCFEE 6253]